MSRINIDQLEVNNSELKELNHLEMVNIVGGYEQKTPSTQDMIQQAMEESVIRRDILNHGNPILINRVNERKTEL